MIKLKLNIPERICDGHIHCGSFPHLRLSFRLEDLDRLMRKYNIDKALVMSSYVQAESITQGLLRAAETDRRLYVLLRGDPAKYREPAYVKRMERQLRLNDQVVGVKINSSTEKFRPTDPIYSDVLEMLNDNGGLLLLHCGRWVEMSGWQYGIELASRYQDIKVILAHMGGTHPDLSFPAIEAAKKFKNVYMDTSQTRQIKVIKEAVDSLGASRILFASDTPWGSYLQNLIGVEELDLKEDEKHKILRQNFNDLIGERSE